MLRENLSFVLRLLLHVVFETVQPIVSLAAPFPYDVDDGLWRVYTRRGCGVGR